MEVIAIVYLTLITEKELNTNYSIKDETLRKSIQDRNLIVPISVINKKNEISFLDGFIKKCLEEFSQKDELARVYYDQYYKLIKSLGGDAVTKDLDWATIKDIYADEKKLEAFNIFGSLWDRREYIIRGIITELLTKENFTKHPFTEPSETMYFKIDDEISLGYHFKGKSFGFVNTPGTEGLNKERQEDLKMILENKKLKDIFVKSPSGQNTGGNDRWVWKDVDFNKIRDWEIIVDNFNILKELVKNSTKGE